MPLNVNKDIAKDIHKDKIRHARKPLFQKLDVEFQIAMEKGEDLKPIAEKKAAFSVNVIVVDSVINETITNNSIGIIAIPLNCNFLNERSIRYDNEKDEMTANVI